MSDDSLIKLENVWKIYRLGGIKLGALKGVSLDIERGRFLGIMGPSGSGKSTLLHMIGALDTPTRGKVFLAGHNLEELSESQLAQLRGEKIGFVFQQFNLLSNLSAIENVALPMVFQGKSEDRRQKRARELLKTLGLKERILHRPSELSGGERQRVAIARSLANDPDIIVADEPTGNLDSSTGKIIMEILVDLHKNERKTIVVVTHDPNIADCSETIINILDGEIAKNHKSSKQVLWSK